MIILNLMDAIKGISQNLWLYVIYFDNKWMYTIFAMKKIIYQRKCQLVKQLFLCCIHIINMLESMLSLKNILSLKINNYIKSMA